jgi:hypothetical protein
MRMSMRFIVVGLAPFVSLVLGGITTASGNPEVTIHKLGQGNIAELLMSIDLISTTSSPSISQIFHRYTEINCPPNPMPTECKESTLIITFAEANQRPDLPDISYAFETSPDFDWRFCSWINEA